MKNIIQSFKFLKTINILFIISLFGCNWLPNKSIEKSDKFDKFVRFDSILKHKEKCISLTNSKIDIDSMKVYFKYIDIDNLENLWTTISNSFPPQDTFCKFDFAEKNQLVKNGFFNKNDTDHYTEKYLIGNLKSTDSKFKIICFLVYNENWGKSMYLMSIRKDKNIIDIKKIAEDGGDAGFYTNTELKFENNSIYKFKITNGCAPDAAASFKENIYTIFTNGDFFINNDGTMTKKITRMDSTVVKKQ